VIYESIDDHAKDIKKKYKILEELARLQMKNKSSQILFFVYYSGHGFMDSFTYGINQLE
jgi:hypothetical protein